MAKLTRRRDLTVEMLNAIDASPASRPRALFYAFSKVEIEEDDDFFVRRLIEETGVVVVPGKRLWSGPGTKHFRVVFLPQEEVLEKSLPSHRRVYEKVPEWRFPSKLRQLKHAEDLPLPELPPLQRRLGLIFSRRFRMTSSFPRGVWRLSPPVLE